MVAAHPLAGGRTVVDDLPAQLMGIALRRKYSDAMSGIRDVQMSLFELAPWSDDQRGIPNVLARSALFTTRHPRQPREDCSSLPIYSYDSGVDITYSGKELRAADDELVFQQTLEFAKRRPLGEPVRFTFAEICKAMGWAKSGGAYARIEACLTRLQASALQIASRQVRRLESLSLVRRFAVHERGTRNAYCEVMIEEDMAVLFAGQRYTKLQWARYRALTPTARRLCDWASSHRQPYKLKLESFRLICGSATQKKFKWKQHSCEACDELRESELVEDAFVKGDEVVIIRERAILAS